MSIATTKQTKTVLDNELLQVKFDSSCSPELQCQIALSGSKSVSTICSVESLVDAYNELKDFLVELKAVV